MNPAGSKIRLRWWVLPLILVALLVGAELGRLCLAPSPNPMKVVACGDLLAGCHYSAEHGEVSVRFLGHPGALQPFSLRVGAPWAKEVHASFVMRGMDMGPNHYRLRSLSGYWEAKVVLPACISGRRDWILRLSVDGESAEIAFSGAK
jgi:hypothetical protein